MSFSRKLRRAQANKLKKNAEKEMATKVALFGKLPSNCLTCEAPFDKMNREQVMSWNVVVRHEKDNVNLYCPECWGKAKEIINGLKERIEERNA
tara:strand:+ start:32491 stop:32772 length:282 start_codon:yes stop_codon:yes gene_type:complete